MRMLRLLLQHGSVCHLFLSRVVRFGGWSRVVRFGSAGALASLLLTGIALAPSGSLAGVPTGITTASAATASAITYYVSPKGSDSNSGKSSSQPLRLIQTALKRVRSGDTIKLAAGAYHEQLITLTAGTSGHPITIKGPETGKDWNGTFIVGDVAVIESKYRHRHGVFSAAQFARETNMLFKGPTGYFI